MRVVLKAFATFVVIMLVTTTLTAVPAQAVTDQWVETPGMSSGVLSMVNDPESGIVYAGDDQGKLWGWDGDQWTLIRDFGFPVSAIYSRGSDLYVGYGTYDTNEDGGLALWKDHKSWSTVATTSGGDGNEGRGNQVRAIAEYRGDIVIGGGFLSVTVNGQTVSTPAYAARLGNTTTGFGVTGPAPIYDLVGVGEGNDSVIFSTTGNDASEGSVNFFLSGAWEPVATGGDTNYFKQTVSSMLYVSATEIYAGGGFSTDAGGPVNYFAKWDGSSWATVTGGGLMSADGHVHDIEKVGSSLFLAGSLALNISGSYWATLEYDGTDFSQVGGFNDFESFGRAVTADAGGNVYLGGSFDSGTATGTWSANAAAYLQAADPTVSSVIPASGSTAGNTDVVVAGTGFRAGANVHIGGVACDVRAVTSTKIHCTTQANSAGLKDVEVSLVSTQSASKAGAFTYVTPLSKQCPIVWRGKRPSSKTLPVGRWVQLVRSMSTAPRCRLQIPRPKAARGDVRAPVSFAVNRRTGRVLAKANRTGATARVRSWAVPVRAPYTKRSKVRVASWRS